MESILPLTEEERQQLHLSIELINKNIDFFVIRFYNYFLKTEAGKLFQNTEMDKHYNMFSTALNVIFNHIDNPNYIKGFLDDIIFRHIGYGVLPEYTDYFVNSFLSSLKEVFDDEDFGNTLHIWLKIISDLLAYFQIGLIN